MHFWIDKRSQACGFNNRHGVPASLASGRRRRNKSMVTPVHRFQTLEAPTVTQQLRRPYHQPTIHSRPSSHLNIQLQSTPLSTETVSGSIISRPTPPPELDAPVYIEAPLEGTIDTVHHAQFMRLGGLTKYGMWASFGLTTVSVAATKFYVDHQGTFEILLLCTLGVLSAGLLVSCALTACKRSTTHHIIHLTPQTPRPSATELEITDGMPQRDTILTPISTVTQATTDSRQTTQDLEQPPPPYHIAILLPVKENSCADFPPPTYENAISFQQVKGFHAL